MGLLTHTRPALHPRLPPKKATPAHARPPSTARMHCVMLRTLLRRHDVANDAARDVARGAVRGAAHAACDGPSRA